MTTYFNKINIFIIIALLLIIPCCDQGEKIDEALNLNSWIDLNKKANKLRNDRDYEEAVKVAEKALMLAEKKYGANNIKTPKALNVLGGIYLIWADIPKLNHYINVGYP